VVVERRVMMNCNLADMGNGNLVDVTVKENKAIFQIVHTSGLSLLICQN